MRRQRQIDTPKMNMPEITATWRLRLIGPPVLQGPDGAQQPLHRHAALIAARLALAGPQARASLAALLWPGVDAAHARASLRQQLLRIKLQAGREWIVGDRILGLAPDVNWAPPAPDEAGELLAGVDAGDAEELAVWLEQMRAQRRGAQMQALNARAQQAETEHRLADAISTVQQMLSIEPLSETHHRELMRLHYLNGDTASALRVYEQLRSLLAQEFRVPPSAATQDLRRLLTAASASPMVAAPAPAAAPSRVALMRPPTMIGRDADLAMLQQRLAAGGAVLVLGEAGIGKTRLLNEVLQGRSDVLTAKALPGDAGVPFALLARLLRLGLTAWGRQRQQGAARATAPQHHPALARLLPEMAAAAPAPPTPPLHGASDVDRLALQAAVEQLLGSAGLGTVVVDDLHFADEASLDLLLALACADGLAHLAWCFAQRADEGSPASARLRDTLTRAQRLHVLQVASLTDAQMQALLQSLQLPGVDAVLWAPRLVRHTGGNPLFALETLKQLDVSSAAPTALPQPTSVVALIERRLAQLSERAMSLARVASIAGPDFGADLAVSVLQRPAVELADAWIELEAAQVLRGDGFAHDLVFDATLRSIPTAMARHLHAAVATWLQSQGGEPARLAAHWRAAGAPDQAVPWLEQAADRAHVQLRPLEEAGFLEQLVELIELEQPARAVRLLLRLARVQVEAQGFQSSTAPLERALHLAQAGADRLQALSLLAEIQFNRLMPDASARSAEQAFLLARELNALPEAAEAVLRWHRAWCLAGRAAQGETMWLAQQGWMADVVLHNAELVSDRGWVLDRLGRTREARAWHRRALTLAQATSRPLDAAVVLGNLVQSLLLSGEPAAASAALHDAEALAARHAGLHGASDYMALYRAMVAAAQGRFQQALQHFEHALADADFQSTAARYAVLAQRAMLWSAIGQRSRALADATQVLNQPALPAWVIGRAHHAMALASARHGVSAGLQRAIDGLGDPAQTALHGPLHLQLLLAGDGTAELAASALRQARHYAHQAQRDGHVGLRWAAHWAAAQLAITAGRHASARRHAAACLARPASEVAPLLTDGVWWHGLWTVWLALGDAERAETALAAGRAWMAYTLQQHLPAEFHASFREVVPAHQALWRGLPRAA